MGNKVVHYPNTNVLVSGIEDEHDQPGMCISIHHIESPWGRLILVLKGRKTSRKFHVDAIFADHFSKLTYAHFSESTVVYHVSFKC